MRTVTAEADLPLSTSVDAIKESVDRLERLLPRREDSAVLMDFLEDDLREGLDAIAQVESHFNDVVDALRSDRVGPISLLEVAEDFRVLNRLEYLMVVVSQLRKRLAQAAGKMHAGG
jgi:polyhydroxyalkanoate synthesis regulator phasin